MNSPAVGHVPQDPEQLESAIDLAVLTHTTATTPRLRRLAWDRLQYLLLIRNERTHGPFA